MTRLLSGAAIGALLVVTIWFLPVWVLAGAAAVVAAIGTAEGARLAAAIDAKVSATWLAFTGGAVAIAFASHASPVVWWDGDALAPVLAAIVIGAGVLALASGAPSPAAFTRAAVLFMMPIYVGIPIGALIWIALSGGSATVTWLIAVIATSDTAQYYTGRSLGRRKLAPLVSPAKTVEGAMGGFAGGAVAAVVAGAWWLPDVPAHTLVVLGLLLAAFGMAGDLFESLLKRSAGVKDSGAIIPGHGGVLDRIDSYLFAAPCFYVYLRYIR